MTNETSLTRMTGRERLKAVLAGKTPDRLPNIAITMMLAADFIGESYRSYATDWRVLAHGQTAVSDFFGFDHVSVISDPAVEAADCGAAVIYTEHQPPALDEHDSLLRDRSTLLSLRQPAGGNGRRMANRLTAIEALKREAGSERLVEGWIEGPVAEAADLRGINRLMTDFYDDPEFVRDLFDFILEMELGFAREQVEAGADWIGIGDAACSLLGPGMYREFVHSFHTAFIDGIHALGAGVRLHICGNMTALLPHMADLEPDVLDLDSLVPVAAARAALGPETVLSGNISPVDSVLNGTPESITAELVDCFADAGYSRYAVNAGCEIPRESPRENVLALFAFAESRRWK